MRIPTDEEIMIALCCGEHCRRNGDTYCHRFDFEREAERIRALLEREDYSEVILVIES